MLELHDATPTDAQDLTEVFLAAFSDPFNRTMFPPTAEVKSWIGENFLNGNGLASEHEVILKATNDNGKPVAFAKWVRSYHAGADRDLQSDNAVREWPVGSDKDLCETFFGTMSDLEILGVHPSYQGRGLASKLLKWGLARADEEGVEVYLSSSPDGKLMY
ncbi:Acetyltransferase GNAT family [Penicillium sp. IBT 16267x]|nr:Acetyltransferase GNAT family [Penicillium sp. IBT 16267x]